MPHSKVCGFEHDFHQHRFNLYVVLRLTCKGDECPGGTENERHRLQRCICTERWVESLGNVRLPGRSDLANEKLFGIILSVAKTLLLNHLLLESPSGNLSQFMRLDENGLKSASAGQAHCML